MMHGKKLMTGKKEITLVDDEWSFFCYKWESKNASAALLFACESAYAYAYAYAKGVKKETAVVNIVHGIVVP